MGKVLTEVRSTQRTLIPDAEDWEHYELPSLRGIARKAKQQPAYRFRDLSSCLNKTHMKHAFKRMNKKAASGVDKVSYTDYRESFDENVESLIGQLKRQSYKAKLVKKETHTKSTRKNQTTWFTGTRRQTATNHQL